MKEGVEGERRHVSGKKIIHHFYYFHHHLHVQTKVIQVERGLGEGGAMF